MLASTMHFSNNTHHQPRPSQHRITRHLTNSHDQQQYSGRDNTRVFPQNPDSVFSHHTPLTQGMHPPPPHHDAGQQ
ncbi:hypothetical protein GCM10027169_01000 [Gordonia jinhuaensis]|uniref:Uncharacterized protein n=1 Tax=Gordonia jinhuaensis TaxID=1517702 RepID=A0A916TJL5_9ACTN|nr:hypothetical protein GCM10011489_39570 [Gordonia jinhuaensis]